MANVAATPRYHRRRWGNRMATALSIGAAAFGLSWLVLILLVLVVKGVGGLSLAVFTEMTPPPGGAGGLLNPIVGSLILTVLAVLFGTPLGMLAGTYMAEYGRYSKLTMVVRFINDILFSAPSIVVGLFVYEIMVAQMGHFSAWAGAVALAIIVIPVVVRTTEDMLLLVPNTLREAVGRARHAAMAGDQERGLSRRARRHHHRRAARHRPHHRRDRASSLHGAQQPILQLEPERADGELAGGHFPVRLEPLRGLAATCLDRGSPYHRHRAGLEHLG